MKLNYSCTWSVITCTVKVYFLLLRLLVQIGVTEKSLFLDKVQWIFNKPFESIVSNIFWSTWCFTLFLWVFLWTMLWVIWRYGYLPIHLFFFRRKKRKWLPPTSSEPLTAMTIKLFKSSYAEVFYKMAHLKYFTKSSEKRYVMQSFFGEVANNGPTILLKRTQSSVFSQKFCQIFSVKVFCRTPMSLCFLKDKHEHYKVIVILSPVPRNWSIIDNLRKSDFLNYENKYKLHWS